MCGNWTVLLLGVELDVLSITQCFPAEPQSVAPARGPPHNAAQQTTKPRRPPALNLVAST